MLEVIWDRISNSPHTATPMYAVAYPRTGGRPCWASPSAQRRRHWGREASGGIGTPQPRVSVSCRRAGTLAAGARPGMRAGGCLPGLRPPRDRREGRRRRRLCDQIICVGMAEETVVRTEPKRKFPRRTYPPKK